MNKHVCSHNFKCGLCAKMFDKKESMEEHSLAHDDEATKALKKKNKTVSWNENLEEVKEIAVNKVPVTMKLLRRF